MKVKTTPIAMIAATALSLSLFGALLENGKAEGDLTVAESRHGVVLNA